MKIGIDLRSVQETAIHRGIGKYVISLLRELSLLDHDNQYYLFLYTKQSDFAYSQLPHTDNIHFIFLEPSRLRTRKFIRTFVIDKEALRVDSYNLDVLFQMDKLFPVAAKTTPVVSIVHDLIPQIFKEQYQTVTMRHKSLAGLIIYCKELRLRQLTNRAMQMHKNSDAVIAISNHTAKDLVRLTPVNPHKITIVPHGAETVQSVDKPMRPAMLPKNAQFIFQVGGVDPRKQLPLLVRQFADLSKKYPDLYLVLGGKETTDPKVPQAVELKKEINKLKLTERVLLVGYLSDEELAYLYKHAVAFVLSSKYEGFGLQILEAYLAGCPVVAYANSSIPEVAGDAALLVEDGQPLTPAIEKLLIDPSLREKLIKQGMEQAKKFTWNNTAKATLAVLQEAAKHAHRN